MRLAVDVDFGNAPRAVSHDKGTFRDGDAHLGAVSERPHGHAELRAAQVQTAAVCVREFGFGVHDFRGTVQGQKFPADAARDGEGVFGQGVPGFRAAGCFLLLQLFGDAEGQRAPGRGAHKHEMLGPEVSAPKIGEARAHRGELSPERETVLLHGDAVHGEHGRRKDVQSYAACLYPAARFLSQPVPVARHKGIGVELQKDERAQNDDGQDRGRDDDSAQNSAENRCVQMHVGLHGVRARPKGTLYRK